MTEVPEQPKKSGADTAYGIVKAVVSAVPVLGGPATEVIGLIFGPPLEKRREKWLHALAGAVLEVQQQIVDLTPEKLSQDAAFVTVALQASEIAVRTHQEEKLIALKNAVVNSVLPDAPDETLQQIFLNHVGALTAWHLRVLKWLAARPAILLEDRWVPMNAPNFPHFLEELIPELKGQGLFCEQLILDLTQRGLVVGGSSLQGAQIAINGQWRQYAPKITEVGSQFLHFVSKHGA